MEPEVSGFLPGMFSVLLLRLLINNDIANINRVRQEISIKYGHIHSERSEP